MRQPSAMICPSRLSMYDAQCRCIRIVLDQQHCLSEPPVKIGQEFQHNFGILAVQISCRLIGSKIGGPFAIARGEFLQAMINSQPIPSWSGMRCCGGRNRPVRKMLQHLFQQAMRNASGMQTELLGNSQSSIWSEACEFVCKRMVLCSPSSRFSPRQRMK